MEIIHSIFDFASTQKTFVTIGTFDGVHVGHQKIIKKLVEEAQKTEKKSVLLTFFPHPRMVLQKEATIKLINTINERAKLLKKTGLDYLIIHPFDKDFSQLTAFDFVRDILANKLNTTKLIIGYDHHFGKNREGNIEQLTKYSSEFNFEVEEIPAQDIDEVLVSSTKIRKALLEGNIAIANNFLGYRFSISGKVVSGRQLGGKIGYPTANLKVNDTYKLIPKTGVYVVKSSIDNKNIFGMMNIGNRPTVDGKNQTIEVHFFDFHQNLYEKDLTIEMLHFIRDEQKFESIDHLISQLKKDEQTSRDFIRNNQ